MVAGALWRETWRKTWLPGALLCALAIAIRLLVATRREGIESDGIAYLQNATALFANWREVNVLHPPLYSLLLAPFLGVWNDPEWTARVLSAVLGGLWIWPTLWLADETTDEAVLWTAGLLVALTPSAIEASTKVLAEATFGLCLTLFLFVLVRTLRVGSWGLAVATGILGGLSTLARPEGMAYLALAWVLLILAPALFGSLWTRRLVLARLAIVTVCWIAIVSPYMALVRSHTGHWHWSGKGGVSLVFGESVGDEQQASFYERRLAELRSEDVPSGVLAYALAHPGAMAKRVAINLHLIDKYVISSLLAGGGFALLVLGIVQLRFRRPPGPPEWILAVVPLPLAGVLVYLVDARYFVSLIPVFAILGGIGLARLPAAGGSPRGRLSRRSLLWLTLVLISFVPWIVRPWFRQDPAAVEKAAGMWLRRTGGPKVPFIGSYGSAIYYTESHAIPFALHSLESLIQAGRRAGVRYLLADNYRLPQSRPDLAGLLGEKPPASPDLELVHRVEDRAGRRILIYRIR